MARFTEAEGGRVFIGCAYPSIGYIPPSVAPRIRKRIVGRCSCGWEGERRWSSWKADEDMVQHLCERVASEVDFEVRRMREAVDRG